MQSSGGDDTVLARVKPGLILLKFMLRLRNTRNICRCPKLLVSDGIWSVFRCRAPLSRFHRCARTPTSCKSLLTKEQLTCCRSASRVVQRAMTPQTRMFNRCEVLTSETCATTLVKQSLGVVRRSDGYLDKIHLHYSSSERAAPTPGQRVSTNWTSALEGFASNCRQVLKKLLRNGLSDNGRMQARTTTIDEVQRKSAPHYTQGR